MTTQTNHLNNQPIQVGILRKRMIICAGIALAVICIFILPIKHPNPAWGKFWMIRPLIITPLAGAGGGMFYYLVHHFTANLQGWKKALIYLFSFIGCLVALWLGIVLGLSGTLWN